MDMRAEKIAKARQKLKDHQAMKVVDVQKEQCSKKSFVPFQETQNNSNSLITDTVIDSNQHNLQLTEKIDVVASNGNNNIEKKFDVNITEILISTKTNLEVQIKNLTEKLIDIENLHNLESTNHNITKQKVLSLEQELGVLSNKYDLALQDISIKNETLSALQNDFTKIRDENNNLVEQLEFTKSMLSTKEYENTELHNKLSYCLNQIDVLQLQIQQLTNSTTAPTDQSSKTAGPSEALVKKISNLEKTIESLQKERDQINCHYEHYVNDLNKQYRSEVKRNENLAQEIQNLYSRENSLIEQISDMEIRMQNYIIMKNEKIQKQESQVELQNKLQASEEQLVEVNAKYEELQKQYMDSLEKIKELSQVKETECNHDNISINKLNADITSDKIAAQRATEQNRKLKSDVEDLEQVIVKLGNDKLELTEMWTHEKQLNKGIALKLAEAEENLKNSLKQLKAKDEEMIRLLNEIRDLERKYESMIDKDSQSIQEEDIEKTCEHDNHECHNHHNHTTSDQGEIPAVISDLTPLVELNQPINEFNINSHNIMPKQDAMSKLQERFLNIMDQVANLSDEKHRLEHIILQLQTETDTICEYVALYQQQRSLLKKREEERSNQLKIYQTECNKLKQHLEELRNLLLKFAGDQEMESFFKEDQRHNDLMRVKELLEELQNCSLINPKFKHLDLNIFYPCSCCSGQVIDI
ncbi:golgin subfamily A member 2 [Bicyclus anynana]|uniref:Golgin subfamily A member 2 n=1 Tax=Bicyclus anynana TaxID=110368 RepID=A0A6J1PBL9_BICAN|nr:golgin subfamily A member 2 [Bicyclus anynana]